jgi:hypothetical protein
MHVGDSGGGEEALQVRMNSKGFRPLAQASPGFVFGADQVSPGFFYCAGKGWPSRSAYAELQRR